MVNGSEIGMWERKNSKIYHLWSFCPPLIALIHTFAEKLPTKNIICLILEVEGTVIYFFPEANFKTPIPRLIAFLGILIFEKELCLLRWCLISFIIIICVESQGENTPPVLQIYWRFKTTLSDARDFRGCYCNELNAFSASLSHL